MRQSIATSYIGPTDTKGSRVIAKSASGHRISLDWDSELNTDQNHIRAAQALARKLEWTGRWHGGGSVTGYVFVNEDSDSFTI